MEAAAFARGGARIRVLDRGRGVDPSLRESIFSPGVTTKPSGSGSASPSPAPRRGSTAEIFSVAPRTGGGTVAELTLGASAGRGGGDAG